MGNWGFPIYFRPFIGAPCHSIYNDRPGAHLVFVQQVQAFFTSICQLDAIRFIRNLKDRYGSIWSEVFLCVYNGVMRQSNMQSIIIKSEKPQYNVQWRSQWTIFKALLLPFPKKQCTHAMAISYNADLYFIIKNLPTSTSFFQVTCWSPKWRSLNPWKGHKTPQRVTRKNLAHVYLILYAKIFGKFTLIRSGCCQG